MVARTFDRNITVIVHKASEPLWVNAEPSYLEQALLNMCINARDAMPQGGTLTLEATSSTLIAQPPELPAPCAPGRYASISVQDTGAGIAPDTLPRVSSRSSPPRSRDAARGWVSPWFTDSSRTTTGS